MEMLTRLHKTLLAGVGVVSMGVSGGYYVNSVVQNLATKDDINALRTKIDSITGDNSILQLRRGYTYVAEPVSIGQPTIVIHGWGRRTSLGATCIWEGTIALFEDQRMVPMPGEFVGTGRQFTQRYEPFSSEFLLPAYLTLGRVTVIMQSTYTCSGQTFVENSDPIPFILQE